jgi:hypothetical protein
MSKCHVRELSNVYCALFQDALYAFPTLGAEFEKDLTRLKVLVERRGIRVYLDDLPAVGKHLDRCLAGGQYNLSGLPLTKRFSNRVVIPKFLRGLYLLVFHEGGSLREDCNAEAVFFLRQILYAAKKATYACSFEKTRDEVLEFIETDAQLPEPEGYWNAADPSLPVAGVPYQGFGNSPQLKERIGLLEPRLRPDVSLFLTMLDKVSSLVTTTLGVYDPAEWRFRHGPGAIAETVGPSNKYSWTNWSESLESEYPLADCGFHNFASWADKCNDPTSIGSSEPSSRLVAVPKTYSGPRLIAAEPSEHQWCQQNSWNYFCSRTSSGWIGRFVTFRDQSRNQLLCCRGSETGSVATVDLSAASDRVTCHVVGQYFRSNPKLLSCLRASRTRSVQQSLVRDAPRVIELRKFSTMGSANTFPVETLIFLGVALASVLVSRKLRCSLENIMGLTEEVAVFGDDIVIPSDSRELFVEALEVLYFKVNRAKSFWTGRFRESCGVDSFRGVNVTPAYWKCFYDGGPESLASVTESANNFYKKWLLNTSAYLASTLPRSIPMVAMSSGVAGLKSRLPVRNSGFPRRYNRYLHRDEIRVLTTIASQRRIATNDDTALLQYFTEEPSPDNIWVHGVPQRPRLQKKPRWVPEELVTAQ